MMSKTQKENGRLYLVIASIVTIFGIAGFLLFQSFNSQKSQKTLCKENYCIVYDEAQIELTKSKSELTKDHEVLYFNKLGIEKYADLPLIEFSLYTFKNKSIDEYIAKNNEACDEIVINAEETGGEPDCRRLTKIGDVSNHYATFTEVSKSGGSGHSPTINYYSLNKELNTLYEFECNISSFDELELLSSGKIDLFKKTDSFKTCEALVRGFRFVE